MLDKLVRNLKFDDMHTAYIIMIHTVTCVLMCILNWTPRTRHCVCVRDISDDDVKVVYSSVTEATVRYKIWRMRLEYWLPKAAPTHTHTICEYFLLCHGTNGTYITCRYITDGKYFECALTLRLLMS